MNKQNRSRTYVDPSPALALVGQLHPPIIDKGKGAFVWFNGTRYVDCSMGWGSIILGHSHPKISKVVRRQIGKCVNALGSSRDFFKLEKLIQKMVPCAEQIRLGKNGSDATLACVRLARAYTGRTMIARCGYHGFHDWSLADDLRNKGIPECLKKEIIRFEFNDIESLYEKIEPNTTKIAAIMIEPCIKVLATRQFLQSARNLADKIGAVLIYDEIITGFRLRLGGIQELYGILPDLVSLGKSVANGLPLSIVAGKKEIMNEMSDIYYGLTFEQERLSLCAAVECLTLIRDKNIPDLLGKKGRILKKEYQEIANKIGLETKLIGSDQRPYFDFASCREFGPSIQQLMTFIRSMYANNMLITDSIFLSAAHSDRILELIIRGFKNSLNQVTKSQKKNCWFEQNKKLFKYLADMEITIIRSKVNAGQTWQAEIQLENIGNETWQSSGPGKGSVNLGAHLFDSKMQLINFDYFRCFFPKAVSVEKNKSEKTSLSDDSFHFSFDIPVPGKPGDYYLEFDLVCEGVSWFKDYGSRTEIKTFTVL